MASEYIAGQRFESVSHADNPLVAGEYDNCTFNRCDFGAGSLNDFKFIDCGFTDCNFSNCTIARSFFQDVRFQGCKMLGVRFDECNPFGYAAQFEKCQLNHSSFYKMSLKRTSFQECQLHGTDFGMAEMKGTSVMNCDLHEAIFEQTNLQKADLRGSVNFHIDPDANRIHGARFSLDSVPGLLDKFKIRIER